MVQIPFDAMEGAGPTRVFLGWSRPLLDAVRDHLMGMVAAGGSVDLGGAVVVVPGSRAARGLMIRLVDAAEGRALVPPRIVTPGEAMGILWPVSGRVAQGLECRAAWIEALRGAGPDVVGALSPHPPARDDVRGWSGLGALLERCGRELGAELLRFADVPRRMGAGFPEHERWRALALVQAGYERVLRDWGMVDADLARIADGPREPPAGRVVVAGVADMPRSMREAVVRMGDRATVLVFAPQEWADRFDDVGCVVPERWAGVTLGLSESAVVFADGPGDQADRALEAIGEHRGLASDEVVVGVPDAEVIPAMRRRAERCADVKVRYAGGTPVSRTAPWRLLSAAAEFLEQRTVASLAALVRHPDLERWLVARMPERAGRGREWWLDALDEYLEKHLHGPITGAWAPGAAWGALLGDLLRCVGEALEGLDPPRGEARPARRPAGEWVGAVLGVLARVYGGRALVRANAADRAVIESLGAIRDAAAELGAARAGTATSSEAVRLVLERAGAGAVPEEADAGAIEMLGWLELPADPAPVAVITGLNEGRIPSSARGDPLLPESVRGALGVGSAAVRLARDCYVLASVVHSRAHVTLIAGRRSDEGNPLWPSRLLLMEEGAVVGARVRRFTERGAPGPRRRVRVALTPGPHDAFLPMRLCEAPPLQEIAVTSFRTYLASPYWFYLRHVARLIERDDGVVELDGGEFGSLIHDALQRFGRSPERDSADVGEIEKCLEGQLAALASARFGSRPPPAVRLQIEFARRRLMKFAAWQAAQRAAGWKIRELEWRPPAGHALLDLGGTPMRITGRVDRIDVHEGTGAFAILDYKTGDSVDDPDKEHRGRAGWTDLQLPLYRHLCAELGLGETLVLGYVILPRDADGMRLSTASWSAADLASADERAKEVARAVMEGRFGELGPRPPSEGVEAWLCGLGFLGGRRRGGEA